MKFIGRAQELATLEEEFARESSFVVVYGRRRVGKTRLIKQFIEDKKALYFLASKETEALNIQRFASDVAAFNYQPEISNATYTDWRPLFQYLANFQPSTRKVLVIDELPYLIQSNPALPSVLQYVWDEILARANVMLILCGSHTHMMQSEVLDRESPLYGRRTSQIKLQPLSFSEMQAGFANRSFMEQLQIYGICGGVPKYLELFANNKSVRENITKEVLQTSGFLYDEPRFLLAQDTRNPINHYSLLHLLAQNNRRPNEMATRLQREQNELSPYLKTLVELGYIERRVPATEKNPDRSKMGLYYISDPLFAFWFTYVQPFEGELEMGNARPSLDAITKTFISNYLSFTFEEVSRQAITELCANGAIDFSPSRIGGYWDKKGSVEIDICATETQSKRLLLGECKLHERKAFSLSEYRELIAKREALFPDEEVVFVVSSQTGFDARLTEEAHRDSVVLLNKCRLV